MRRLGIGVAAVLIAAAVFQASDVALNEMRSRRVPKNFAAVVPGVLYRSGQLRPEHLGRVLREHAIRTVVCLNPGESPAEMEMTQKAGARHVRFDMPGSGRGRPEDFHEILRIVADPDARPVLVHCSAGAYRTGVAVALFRMAWQGWSEEDALREMHYHGCAIHRDADLLAFLRSVRAAVPRELSTLAERGEGLGSRRATFAFQCKAAPCAPDP